MQKLYNITILYNYKIQLQLLMTITKLLLQKYEKCNLMNYWNC